MKPIVIATVCMTFFSTVTWAGESVEREATMKPGKRLEVHNRAGSVEIEGWNKDRIQVTGDLSGRNSELKFINDRDKVLVKIVSERRHKHGSAELVIFVPKETHIEVTGVSTDIEVTNITGRQHLSTVSGDIDAEIDDDEVHASTVSGDVEVAGQGIVSVLEVTTVSGEADVENVAGDVMVSTTSGDIDVSGNGIRRLDLGAVSGDIDVEGKLNDKARVDIETVNGDVWLEVRKSVEAEFDLESFNGSISSIDGHSAKRQSKYGPGRYLEYTRGAGAARVRINTLNGDIDIASGK